MSRNPNVRRLRIAALLAATLTGLLSSVMGVTGATAAQDQPGAGSTVVTTTEVRGVITPVIANHLADAITLAEEAGSEALVVLLDTPGGLITSMRSIVQDFLEADVPVVVYVSPRGADAGSAGTYITMSAHVAAMAPATTIGAATPVDIQGGEISDKIINNAAEYARAIAEERGRDIEFAEDAVRKGRTITVVEAVEIGVVDFQASDLEDLLAQLDGRQVTLASGDEVTISTASARVEEANLSGARSILQRLADPNLAFIFLSIATLAIIYEIASPGLGAGGVVGITLIILAMFSLSVLPVNYAGAALLVLAGVLFILELFMPGVGVAAAGGTITLVLGGLFLFQRPTGIGIELSVILPTAAVLLAGTVLAGRFARRTLSQAPIDTVHGLVGREAVASLRDSGTRIRIDGTWWSADSDVELVDGQDVVVTAVDGMRLTVAPAAQGATATTSTATTED